MKFAVYRVFELQSLQASSYLLTKAKGLWIQDWPISDHYASRDR